MGINQRAGRNGGRRQLSWMFSWSCLGVFLEFSSSFSLYFPSDINHQFGSSSAPPAPAPFLTTFLQLSYNCLGTFFLEKSHLDSFLRRIFLSGICSKPRNGAKRQQREQSQQNNSRKKRQQKKKNNKKCFLFN